MQVKIDALNKLFEKHAKDACEAVIVAPFVKTKTVHWLLGMLDENCKIRLLTRARLFDFILGASDVECWPAIWNCGGEIFIEQSLHAKYYRFDQAVFTGSANVTESALSRSNKPNLELLNVQLFDETFREIEKSLFVGRIKADKLTYKRLKSLIDRYKQDKAVEAFQRKIKRLQSRHDSKFEMIPLPDRWCFQTKRPSLLLAACLSPESLSSSDMEAALNDLKLLCIEPSEVLTEGDLRRTMEARLKSWCLVRRLHRCFDTNETPDYPYLRYGFIREAFGLEDDCEYDSHQGTVNAFFDWMIEFLPRDFFEAPRRHTRLLGRFCDLDCT